MSLSLSLCLTLKRFFVVTTRHSIFATYQHVGVYIVSRAVLHTSATNAHFWLASYTDKTVVNASATTMLLLMMRLALFLE